MTSPRSTSNGQREFLNRILLEGARRLGCVLSGDVTFGWRDRTIGSAATIDASNVWVRATGEHSDWARGEAWTGNEDASALSGVPKPELLGRVQWEEPPVVICAEMMTYVPDRPCSPEAELWQPIDLPDSWWKSLRKALDNLAAQSTARGGGDPASYVEELEELFGRNLSLATPELRTEHTDLHWANLTRPNLWILDWEYWGCAPAGYGVSMLYLHSLLAPNTAARVYAEFADLLETPSGQVSRLSAAAHILGRAHRIEDYQELQHPVRAHAHHLLSLTEI